MYALFFTWSWHRALSLSSNKNCNNKLKHKCNPTFMARTRKLKCKFWENVNTKREKPLKCSIIYIRIWPRPYRECIKLYKTKIQEPKRGISLFLILVFYSVLVKGCSDIWLKRWTPVQKVWITVLIILNINTMLNVTWVVQKIHTLEVDLCMITPFLFTKF